MSMSTATPFLLFLLLPPFPGENKAPFFSAPWSFAFPACKSLKPITGTDSWPQPFPNCSACFLLPGPYVHSRTPRPSSTPPDPLSRIFAAPLTPPADDQVLGKCVLRWVRRRNNFRRKKVITTEVEVYYRSWPKAQGIVLRRLLDFARTK